MVKLLCMYELKNTDTPMTVVLILRCICIYEASFSCTFCSPVPRLSASAAYP